VADEDRDKTTFVCHEGAYRYIRLPFGLSNAPATFQRAIDMILGGLMWKSCLVYLDDIIVFSQSAGEHVEHLREVFTAPRGAGVSLKAKKCHLFQAEVEYLGHIVGPGELKVQDKNIRGLKEASPPRCKKELRSFLGMCNVYRRFVMDYAQVARPLAAMKSSKRPDRWGTLSDEALGAFGELKRRFHRNTFDLSHVQVTVDTARVPENLWSYSALLVVSPKRPSPHQRHSSSSPRWSTQARHAHTPAHTLNQNAHQIKASRIKAKRTQIRASESQEQKM